MAVLADFGTALSVPAGPLWQAYDAENWLAPASGLAIGMDDNGLPQVHLALTRGALPGRPPDPFAMLDITVVTGRDIDPSLAALRDHHAGATLTFLAPDRCHIHLGDPLLSAPVGDPLDMVSSGQSRMIRQLGWDSGLALKAVLEAGINPFHLAGSAGYVGISPRVGAVVGFDGGLIAALQTCLSAPVFTRDDLERDLLIQLETLPMTGIDGASGPFRDALCATLADRIFGTLTQPLGSDAAYRPIARLTGQDIAPARWDLLTPYITTRWLPLGAQDNTLLDQHLARKGAAGIVTERVLAAFPRHQHRLECHLNFPASAPDIHALGVSVQAPAFPPYRPAAANAAAIVTADFATLTLLLSPGEPLAYTLSCFCVVETASGVQQFFGAPQMRNDTLMVLSPTDFGVSIYNIKATQDLLDMASLQLSCSYEHEEQTILQTCDLTDSDVTVIVPREATNGQLTLTATQHQTAATLTLGPMPLRTTTVSAHLFAGFGPQSATLVWGQADDSTLAIEVMPSAQGGSDQQTLAFTRLMPTRVYRYNSQTPFAPGFHYRKMGSPQWQYHADPNVVLVL